MFSQQALNKKKHFARGATEKKQNIITIKVEYYVAVGEISFLFTPDKTITICTYSNIFKKIYITNIRCQNLCKRLNSKTKVTQSKNSPARHVSFTLG